MRAGLDVSHWNGLMNWQTAKDAGAEFAYIKATQGISITDSMFLENIQNAEGKVLRGAYLFFQPELDGAAQATKFTTVAPDLELPPAVDVEVNSQNVGQAVFRQRLLACLDVLEERYGMKPVIYTRASFWNPQIGNVSWASHYPLWVAHYTTASSPALPWGWVDWTLWQYSAGGNGRGAEFGAQSTDIDLDRMKNAFFEANSEPQNTDLQAAIDANKIVMEYLEGLG